MKTNSQASERCPAQSLDAVDHGSLAVSTGDRQTEERTPIDDHSLKAGRSNARVLLVEDNLTNQTLASGLLRRMGWDADVKANGKEAVQALETHLYALVLMDVEMPEMDGYAATRIIRDPQSRVLNHSVPIIATTAHGMAGDVEKCLAAGMSDYIAKPIDAKVLSKVVEKWMRRTTHSAAGKAAVESGTACNGLSKKPPTLVFNREGFLERMVGDEELAQEVVAKFVEELPALLIEIKEQVALGALESISKHAHRIKGAAANVGGEALRDLAWEMEQAGNAGDLARVVRGLPDLEMQATRLIAALQYGAR